MGSIKLGHKRANCGYREVLSFLVFMAGVAVASPAASQTIDQAMTRATQRDPAVKAGQFEARAAEAEVGAAFSGYFPELSVDGSLRRDTTQRVGVEKTLTRRDYSVTMTQPIFDGLGTPARVAEARSNAKAADLDAQAKANDIALQAAKAYLSVLRQTERLKLLKAHEKKTLSIARRIDSRAKVDSGLRSLTVIGRSEIEQAHYLVLEAERNVSLARAQYREIVGTEPEGLTEPKVPGDLLSLSEEEAIARAIKNHAALSSARAQARAAEDAGDVARSQLFPRLDAEVQARNGRNIDGVVGQDNDYYVGLRLTYRFATGGQQIYNTRAAGFREQAALMRIHDVTRNIRLNVMDGIKSFHANRNIHEALLRRKKSAARIVRIYDQQFIGGQRDLLDLFFVLSEERSADDAELEARYAELRAAYTVLASMGVLGPKAMGSEQGAP